METQVGTEVLTDLYIGDEDAYVDDAERVFNYVSRHRTVRIEDQLKALVDRGDIDIAAASEPVIGPRTIRRLRQLLGTEA